MDMSDIRDKIVPTNDYIFKKLFGEEKDKIILISFLNALFKEYDFLPYIKDVTIKNSENKADSAFENEFYRNHSGLDIKAKIDNETYIDIETINKKLSEIVPKQQQIRSELEEIIKELEADYHE